MLTTRKDFLDALLAVYPSCKLPDTWQPGGDVLYVPTMEWVTGDWAQQWLDYRNARPTLKRGVGTCVLWSMLSFCEQWIDCEANDMYEAMPFRPATAHLIVTLAPGVELNGIGAPEGGGHCTQLRAITSDNGKTFRLYADEPQSGFRTPIDQLPAGVTVDAVACV
jgi:hypothetical protein